MSAAAVNGIIGPMDLAHALRVVDTEVEFSGSSDGVLIDKIKGVHSGVGGHRPLTLGFVLAGHVAGVA